MEALECIKTRRSVRRFTEEPVTPEQVAEVVAAAAYAPSWKIPRSPAIFSWKMRRSVRNRQRLCAGFHL